MHVSLRRGLSSLFLVAIAVTGPVSAARAACTWVDSITAWNGSIAWSYQHQASWSAFDHTYDGQTSDQVAISAELDASIPVYAQGPLEGTMAARQRLEDTPPEGLPGWTLLEGSGPVDAYAPPTPRMYLLIDSQNCTYSFSYDDLGANGTSTVKSGCCTNSVPAIVEPGSLVSGQSPIPETPQPLTFSGNVEAVTLPPLVPTPFYIPDNPAFASAEYLGEEQLGTASAQWSFQPTSSIEPLNDVCAGAIGIGAFAQDVSTATAAATDPTPTCGDGDRSVWFVVQAAESGPATVDTQGSDYGTIVSVWPMAQPCAALTTQVSCGNDQASWTAEAGETYRVQVTRASGSTSGLVVTATVPEPDGALPLAAAALTLGWRRMRAARR